jgi:hypothetical protein
MGFEADDRQIWMKKTFWRDSVVHGTGVTYGDAGAIAVPTMTSDHNERCGINCSVRFKRACFVLSIKISLANTMLSIDSSARPDESK